MTGNVKVNAEELSRLIIAGEGVGGSFGGSTTVNINELGPKGRKVMDEILSERSK